MLSSILEVEIDLEWEIEGFLLCDAVMEIGASKEDAARAPKKEDEEDTGEIRVEDSRGSVTLRCTDGREVVYGVKLLMVCEVDSMRR